MKVFIFLIALVITACVPQPKSIHQVDIENNSSETINNLSQVRIGLDILLEEKLDLIRNKSIALVTNHSGLDKNGVPNYKRLMTQKNVKLKIIFSPEHGLFGEAADGEKVNYNGQLNTLPPVASLYGSNRKPKKEQLEGVDVIIYDIQDVGARFYTYITTLGQIMEVASNQGIQIMILDRPNPITGIKVEGPILDLNNRSYVGYYPIPIRYGLTIGELAKMIIGEKWIEATPELIIVPMLGWQRNYWMDEINIKWVNPSPNIPDLETAIVYPGMCLFEATNINEGRGTKKPFKRFGAPWINKQKLSIQLNNLNLAGVVFKPISYIPVDIKGVANNPKYENQVCNGIEIIITNRNDFNSINTALSILSIISKEYPDTFEINKSRMKKLWGKDNLLDSLHSNEVFDKSIDSFNDASIKYHLYD